MVYISLKILQHHLTNDCMHRALLNHLAEFDNSKAKIDQKEPSGLTKEILQHHIHFKLDDDDDSQSGNKDNEHLSHSTMPDPDDEWVGQFSDPKAMEQLAEDWEIKSTKPANRQATCANMIKKMVCEYTALFDPFMISSLYNR